MSIQQKNVSINLVAALSAKQLGAIAELSPTATVVLFRGLVLNERLNVRSLVARELIASKLYNAFGTLTLNVVACLEEAIQHLLNTSGADLMPQPEPTTIAALGHKVVKGKSKTSRSVAHAEQVMRSTAFTIDRGVLALAMCDYTLTKEDRATAIVASSDLLPETFYFPVSYDYRGRMYYRGGILTPQGTDLAKGLITFADKAPIGPHGRFAISVSLADAAGFKGTKLECYTWARKTADLRALATRDVEGLKQGKGYQAAGLAAELLKLDAWCATGALEESFMSGIVCHQDATCSGLQIAAAITGHRETAVQTNCVASNHTDGKSDLYGTVAQAWAAQPTLLGKYAALYGRAMAKKAVMLLGYGAGAETLMSKVSEWLLEEQGITMEWDDTEEKQFMDVLETWCTAAVCIKDCLQKVVPASGDVFEWTTHDGFKVVHDKHAGDEVAIGNFKMTFDEKWEENVNITAVAPNFVHSLDAAQMREAVRTLGKGTPVACIHDSLGVRPCDFVAASEAVRLAFSAIDARAVCVDLCERYGIVLPTLGDYNPAEAVESSYFWC